MKKTWILRKYEEGDEKKIVKLMKSINGSWHSLDYWYWKYRDNCAGFFNDLLWVAEANGEIVGQYTIIPVYMKVGKTEILGSQSVDTIIHQDYRRQGIFEETARRTYDSAKKHNIAITYGFTNIGPSYEGFIKKLDWSKVYFMTHFVRIFNWEKIIKKYTKNQIILKTVSAALKNIYKQRRSPTKTGLEICEIKSFDDEINEFWKEISKEYNAIIRRDRTYLNWRISNPDTTYITVIAKDQGRIVGYAIATVTRKTFRGITLKIVSIADIIALSDYDTAVFQLLNHIERMFKDSGVDAISCTVPYMHRYKKTLSRCRFLKLKTQMAFIVRSNYENHRLNFGNLVDPNQWYIAHLDSDHV